MSASADRLLATENPRRYGEPPYGVAVVHGGPGAPGEMAPVAQELCRKRGVLEPLQTRATLAGQVDELRSILERYGDLPLILVGHSWGAILSYVYAAEYPESVRKLILVSSGSFSDGYVERIKRTRLDRLSPRERERMDGLLRALGDPSVEDKDEPFAELGELIARADSYDPLPHASDAISFQHSVFTAVWGEAEELRRSGKLLEIGRHIACPVVAVHGDFDPHPREGIEGPLAEVLRDFRFMLLERCGHHPWYERHAREEFFLQLERELARA